MYKKTQNSADYIDRTGSHSTKGSRRGFFDLINVREDLFEIDPDQAREELNKNKSLIESMRLDLEKELMPLRANKANWRRNIAYKYKGKEHLYNPDKQDNLRFYFELGELLTHITAQFKELPKVEDNFLNQFINIAEQELPKDVFSDIKNKAIDAVKGKKPLKKS
jgi:hypothetical protein